MSTELAEYSLPLGPFEQVLEFHQIFKPDHIGLFSEIDCKFVGNEDLELKLRLVTEEYEELVEAFNENDTVEVVDALADLIYVINGFAIYLGIDLDEVVSVVHRSNMTKLDENGDPIYRDDGKILKGNNYEPPKIKELLEEIVEDRD